MYILYYTPFNYCSHFFLQYMHIQSFTVNLHIFSHFQLSFFTFFAFGPRFRLFFNTFSSFSRRFSLFFSTVCPYLFFFWFYLPKLHFVLFWNNNESLLFWIKLKLRLIQKIFHYKFLHKKINQSFFLLTKKCQNTAEPHHGISFVLFYYYQPFSIRMLKSARRVSKFSGDFFHW